LETNPPFRKGDCVTKSLRRSEATEAISDVLEKIEIAASGSRPPRNDGSALILPSITSNEVGGCCSHWREPDYDTASRGARGIFFPSNRLDKTPGLIHIHLATGFRIPDCVIGLERTRFSPTRSPNPEKGRSRFPCPSTITNASNAPMSSRSSTSSARTGETTRVRSAAQGSPASSCLNSRPTHGPSSSTRWSERSARTSSSEGKGLTGHGIQDRCFKHPFFLPCTLYPWQAFRRTKCLTSRRKQHQPHLWQHGRPQVRPDPAHPAALPPQNPD